MPETRRLALAEKLTASDKEAIKDELVCELEKKIDTIALQVARVAPTLTAENRRIYEDSSNKSIQNLRDQIRHLQADRFRPFGQRDAIAHRALVKARFEPAGRPFTETWVLIVPHVSQSRLSYKGYEIEVGDGSFGYGGSLLGLRAGDSNHVHGDGRSVPDYSVGVLEVL